MPREVISSDQLPPPVGPFSPGVRSGALLFLSGQAALFYTACAVRGSGGTVHLAHVDTTTVVFRALSTEEIERYVAINARMRLTGRTDSKPAANGGRRRAKAPERDLDDILGDI